MPWEVKDTTVKHTLYTVLLFGGDILFDFGALWSLAQIMVVGNYFSSVWGFMSNAVTQIDLNDDGKTVTLYFGEVKSSKQASIKDIVKL